MRPKKIFTPAFEKLSSKTHGFPLHQEFRVIERWGRDDEATEGLTAPAINAGVELGMLADLDQEIRGFEITEALKYARGQRGDS